MSPVGLNVLEYAYDWFDSGAIVLPVNHLIFPARTGPGWLITKIQAFAAAGASATIGFDAHSHTIDAGGSYCLEPGGALRSEILFNGLGGRIIIEFWYRPVPPLGRPPVIVVET